VALCNLKRFRALIATGLVLAASTTALYVVDVKPANAVNIKHGWVDIETEEKQPWELRELILELKQDPKGLSELEVKGLVSQLKRALQLGLCIGAPHGAKSARAQADEIEEDAEDFTPEVRDVALKLAAEFRELATAWDRLAEIPFDKRMASRLFSAHAALDRRSNGLLLRQTAGQLLRLRNVTAAGRLLKLAQGWEAIARDPERAGEMEVQLVEQQQELQPLIKTLEFARSMRERAKGLRDPRSEIDLTELATSFDRLAEECEAAAKDGNVTADSFEKIKLRSFSLGDRLNEKVLAYRAERARSNGLTDLADRLTVMSERVAGASDRLLDDELQTLSAEMFELLDMEAEEYSKREPQAEAVAPDGSGEDRAPTPEKGKEEASEESGAKEESAQPPAPTSSNSNAPRAGRITLAQLQQALAFTLRKQADRENDAAGEW
jgi:hypothetical protein